jgi:hypothetical protein
MPSYLELNTDMESREYAESLFEYMKRLSDETKKPLPDKRAVMGRLIGYAVGAGDFDSAKKTGEKLNRLQGWYILGPFDNTSGSGHRKDYLAKAGYSLDSTYVGKFGQPVSWFSPPRTQIDGSITATNHTHRTIYTTTYLCLDIEVSKETPSVVSMTQHCDIHFYFDGTLVFDGKSETGGEEIRHWETLLSPGTHTILIKCSNEFEPSNVSLAFSNPDGSEIDGLRVLPWQEEKVISTGNEFVPLEIQLMSEIERLAAQDNPLAEDLLWDLYRLAEFGDDDQVLAACERALELYPESALIHLATANAYAAVGEDDLYSKSMREAAELCPELVQAQVYLAARELDKKRYQSARKTANEILDKAPGCRSALSILLESYNASAGYEDMRTIASNLLDIIPDDPLPYAYLSKYAGQLGQKKQEKEFMKQANERYPLGTEHALELLRLYGEDDFKGVREILEDLVEAFPDLLTLTLGYVEALIATEEYDDAYEFLMEALQNFPQSPRLLYRRSQFVEAGVELTESELIGIAHNRNPEHQMGIVTRPEAAEILEEALRIDPTDSAVRDRVRELRNLQPVHEILKEADVAEISERRVSPEDYADANAVVLLEKRSRFIFDDRANIQDYQLAVQILGPAGVEAWSTFDVGVSQLVSDVIFLHKKTIKPDGGEMEADVTSGIVVFQHVEPGDIVLLNYQVSGYRQGKLHGEFWDHHIFHFNDPCLASSYEIYYPPDLDFDYRLNNAEGYAGVDTLPVRSTAGYGVKKLSWRLSNLPAVKPEPFSPDFRDFLPWLDVSSISSWNTIASWYHDIASEQAEVTRAIREKAAELTEGLSSDEEKIKSILSFVSNDIPYDPVPFFNSAYLPRKAEDVLDNRYGDCKDKACLMIALLNACGIDGGRFALTRTREEGSSGFLPSPRFSHVIVLHEHNDGTVAWYDPTLKYQVYDQLPGYLRGADVLPVLPAAYDISTIPSEGLHEHCTVVSTNVIVDSEGGGRARRRAHYTLVDETLARRMGIESMNDEELKEQATSTLAQKYPGVYVEAVNVSGEEPGDHELMIETVFGAPSMFVDAGGIFTGSYPWIDRTIWKYLTEVTAAPEREAPIDLSDLAVCIQETLRIELPENLRVMAFPEAVDFAVGDFSYSSSVTGTAEGLLATRSVLIPEGLLAQENYQYFKRFVEEMQKDMRRQLLLEGM